MALSARLSLGLLQIYGYASSVSGTAKPVDCRWGYIYGISTQNAYSVNDTVLYRTADVNVVLVYDSVPYDVIDESKIILTDIPIF